MTYQSETASTPNSSNTDQGWTYVKPKSRRTKRTTSSSPTSTSTNPHPHTPPQQSHTHARSHPLRPISDLASEYDSIRSQWQISSSCTLLRTIVATNAVPITRAVCLGIGSFDPPDGGWEAKRRTYVQLIAFLVMVEELESSLNTKIPCLFQEPIFTPHDRAFITSLGHQVVDSPRACEQVDAGTFFYGVHLYRPVYAMALERVAPAIFVGTGWDVWDQVNISSQPSDDLLNLQKMELEYKKVTFPQDTTTTAFSSTSIYFRPQAMP